MRIKRERGKGGEGERAVVGDGGWCIYTLKETMGWRKSWKSTIPISTCLKSRVSVKIVDVIIAISCRAHWHAFDSFDLPTYPPTYTYTSPIIRSEPIREKVSEVCRCTYLRILNPMPFEIQRIRNQWTTREEYFENRTRDRTICTRFWIKSTYLFEFIPSGSKRNKW